MQVIPVATAGEAGEYTNGITIYADDRPEGRGPTGTCIRELKPVIQNDFMNDPNTRLWHERSKKYGFRGSAAFPILIERKAWGSLTVYSDTVGYFGPREINLLHEASVDIGFALENMKKEKLRLWAEAALRKGSEELGLLYEASQELSRSLDLKTVCRALLEFVLKAMPCDSMIVSAYHADSQLINCLYSFDKKLNEIDVSSFPPIPLEQEGKGTQSIVIRSGQPLLLPDYEAYRRTASTNYFIGEGGKLDSSIPDDAERTRSAILVPLKSEGQVVGVIQVFSNQPDAFTREHLRLVESLALHAAAAITNAQLYSRVQRELKEREEAEEALQASEERFRSLYENSTIGIYRTTPDGHILLANPALVRMLGYANFDELSGKDLDAEFFEPLYPRSMFIEQVERDGEIKGLESAWKRKDGTYIYVRESARAIRDMQGQTLYYDGTVEDITERKQAEEARIESEIRYRQLFTSMTEGFALHEIIVDSTGKPYDYRFIEVNPAFFQMTGFKTDALIGKTAREVLPGIEPDWIEIYGKVALSGHPATFENYSAPLKKWFAVYSYSPSTGRFATVFTDITERKHSEEEKQHLEEKAQIASRLAAVGEMAAGIAHEINNPLTSVIGFSELLMEQRLPPDVMEEVKIIADGSRRVADIVKRLLTFARQNKPVRTALNINSLIDNTLKLRTYVLQTANINVFTCYDQDLPWIAADPSQLQQVFLNLIVNAEQAMKSSHNGGQLSIITERRDSRIRIVFRDNGPGIPVENLGRLFEPFFTTKSPGEGTGLGLSLSRAIVLEHGGEIWAESEPGQGATFIVELPISELPEVPKAEELPAPSASARTTTSARILVVDDEPSVREYIHVVLTAAGHTVDGTGDPQEALRIIDGNNYQLIFIDVRMPGMNGPELYNRILQKNPTLAKKIVFITGDTSDAGVKVFLADNKLNFLTKPFEVSTLEEMARSILAEN
jgi:PAS domain S-box-containing protein